MDEVVNTKFYHHAIENIQSSPFSTIYSVALKLKNGSNSFNSNPYSAGWDLIRKDIENAKIKTPIIIR